MKPDINGAAAFIHGYAALLGLGMTRIRNQKVDKSPEKINVIFNAFLLL